MGRHKERVTIQVQLETETGEHDALLKWIDGKKLSREWKETFLKAMKIVMALEKNNTHPVRDHYPVAYYKLVDIVRNKTLERLGDYISTPTATETNPSKPGSDDTVPQSVDHYNRFSGLDKI